MEIMKAAGEEITAEAATQLFEKTQAKKTDRELSLDELEAVSGGSRDWNMYGCQATVEEESWCWSNDSCWYDDVVYYGFDASLKCPAHPGRHAYDQIKTEFITDIHIRATMRCRYCGDTYVSEFDRVVFE